MKHGRLLVFLGFLATSPSFANQADRTCDRWLHFTAASRLSDVRENLRGLLLHGFGYDIGASGRPFGESAFPKQPDFFVAPLRRHLQLDAKLAPELDTKGEVHFVSRANVHRDRAHGDVVPRRFSTILENTAYLNLIRNFLMLVAPNTFETLQEGLLEDLHEQMEIEVRRAFAAWIATQPGVSPGFARQLRQLMNAFRDRKLLFPKTFQEPKESDLHQLIDFVPGFNRDKANYLQRLKTVVADGMPESEPASIVVIQTLNLAETFAVTLRTEWNISFRWTAKGSLHYAIFQASKFNPLPLRTQIQPKGHTTQVQQELLDGIAYWFMVAVDSVTEQTRLPVR